MGLTELAEALIALNQLKKKGVIEDYAIGGGHAVIYHQIPYSTFDLDILAIVGGEDSLRMLQPIYEYFREKGNKIEREHIYIGDMAVQILPNVSLLSNDAVEEAHKVEVEGIPTKVIRIEHLIALSLVAFRFKDKIRISQLIEKANKKLLNKIFDRFDNEESKLRKRYQEVLASSRKV